MGITVEGHEISVVTRPSGNYTVFVAVCTCGKYRSMSHVTSVEANQAGIAHLIAKQRQLRMNAS